MMKKVKKLFGLVKSHFIYKAVFSLCVGIIYCLSAYGNSLNVATSYLELNYPQALYGQYLNGTRLNMYDILSEETLKKAIRKAGLTNKLSAKSLSGMLTVSPRHASRPTDEYIATEFVVGISMKNPINGVDAQGLLQMVCIAFVETFYDAHAYNQTVLNFSLDDIDGMDYDEIGTMLRTKIDLISDYADYRRNEGGDFRSSDTGESFTSLSRKISDFSNIVMENYDAYVFDNGVTRDLPVLNSTLDYEQLLLKKRYDTDLVGYDVRIQAIKDYDPVQSAIVMIPTVDENGEFYMSKTKIGVDYLAELANASMSKAVKTKKTMDHNESRLQIANSTLEADRENSAHRLDKMIDDILVSLGELEQLVIKTDDEYIRQQTAESLIYKIRYATATERYSIKTTLIYMFAAFVALTALLWAYEEWDSKRGQKTGEKNASV